MRRFLRFLKEDVLPFVGGFVFLYACSFSFLYFLGSVFFYLCRDLPPFPDWVYFALAFVAVIGFPFVL